MDTKTYKKILDKIKFSNLYLNKIEANNYFVELSNEQLNIEVKERHTYEETLNELKIKYNYKLTVTDKQNNVIFLIKAAYIVEYIKTSKITITKDFVKLFAKYTINLMLWPYFRQLVHDTTSKMNIPPILLPMKRVDIS